MAEHPVRETAPPLPTAPRADPGCNTRLVLPEAVDRPIPRSRSLRVRVRLWHLWLVCAVAVAVIVWDPAEVLCRSFGWASAYLVVPTTLVISVLAVLAVAGLAFSDSPPRTRWHLLLPLVLGWLALFVYYNSWGMVYGTVTRAGKPLAGAEVEFGTGAPMRSPGPLAWVAYLFDDPNLGRHYRTRTASDGSYYIGHLRPGGYAIRVIAPPSFSQGYKFDWDGDDGPPTEVEGGLQKVDLGF